MPGATIDRRTARVLSILFLLSISLPALHQFALEIREGDWRFLALFRIKPTHESLDAFSEQVAADSAFGRAMRTAFQSVLAGALGEGSGKVLVGSDGFLFLRSEVDMVTGPGFFSRRRISEAIEDFHRRLASRGIRLVFVPIPVKPFIYPEKVWAGYPLEAGPAWSAGRNEFKSGLGLAGVDVLDLTEDLWRAKASGPVFLRMDTHWTPLGLAAAADSLASRLSSLVNGMGGAVWPAVRERVTGSGDLLQMLQVSSGTFAPETVEIERVPGGRGGDSAKVLLLGDSFSNVYSLRQMEWGEEAGLAEQLSRRLGTEVQAIAVNGGGATVVRETLAARPAALKSKRIVVWACSARDLFDESVSWEIVPLPD